jgi:hypothetical protein
MFQACYVNGKAYADLENVRYKECLGDVSTTIQMFYNTTLVSGAVFKKLIWVRLPKKIREQMDTVDLATMTDQEIFTIITNAGRTAEKSDSDRKNIGLKASVGLNDRDDHSRKQND